ncbi:hypothetical protein [Solwaraspora sp. WMMD792]|uniref:hypothetical protein n=1 Tax=Solwaraspora sp. WMMD792 TaxID=3016099 RepID=UPI002415D4A0|nr:hypothetical protein [Solwaraspora sp. WMMD792]MDG4770312.1 hypothetical protein [Solwaraspora sp. WMMD792]
MKQMRYRRWLAAAAAVVVTVPLGARPAQAFDISSVIAAAKSAYELYKEYKQGASLDQSTTKIINTINGAKVEILAQIDRIATAQAKACARSAIIDFDDIKTFTRDNLQAYARDTTACVTLIDSLLEVVTDEASADQLGFTLNTVGPLALTARAHAGLSTRGLLELTIGSNNTVLSALAPNCTTNLLGLTGIPQSGKIYRWETRCVAYNNVVAVTTKKMYYPPTSNPWDIPGTTATAMRNTSHAEARAVLPILMSTPS